ncbi:MAG TPA: exonuclease domain-containing protein [Alphaproteobacteria bacterium]|nr:exonuclease domain-containing protein [Alphaproteobacteria bacterium]
MRVVVLDAEMTDLDLESGAKIIALGLVEVFDKARIGEEKEWFFHPHGRPIPPENQKLHGLTQEFLEQHLIFPLQIDDIKKFIGDSPIAHHCWLYQGGPQSVDEKFMEKEFERSRRTPIDHARWINMKTLARKIDPEHNSLNDMLDRFGIDRSSRNIHHGALIDARLTAELYLRYKSLGFNF